MYTWNLNFPFASSYIWDTATNNKAITQVSKCANWLCIYTAIMCMSVTIQVYVSFLFHGKKLILCIRIHVRNHIFPLKQIDLHSCASIIKINFNKVWLNKTCSQNVFKLQSITSELKWHSVDPTGCMHMLKKMGTQLVSNIMRTWNYFDVYQINSAESQWRVCCRLSNSQLICVQFP